VVRHRQQPSAGAAVKPAGTIGQAAGVIQGSHGGRHSSAPSFALPLAFRAGDARFFFAHRTMPVPSPRPTALLWSSCPRRLPRRSFLSAIFGLIERRKMRSSRQVALNNAVSRLSNPQHAQPFSGPTSPDALLTIFPRSRPAWCGCHAASMRKAPPLSGPRKSLDSRSPKPASACWIYPC